MTVSYLQTPRLKGRRQRSVSAQRSAREEVHLALRSSRFHPGGGERFRIHLRWRHPGEEEVDVATVMRPRGNKGRRNMPVGLIQSCLIQGGGGSLESLYFPYAASYAAVRTVCRVKPRSANSRAPRLSSSTNVVRYTRRFFIAPTSVRSRLAKRAPKLGAIENVSVCVVIAISLFHHVAAFAALVINM